MTSRGRPQKLRMRTCPPPFLVPFSICLVLLCFVSLLFSLSFVLFLRQQPRRLGKKGFKHKKWKKGFKHKKRLFGHNKQKRLCGKKCFFRRLIFSFLNLGFRGPQGDPGHFRKINEDHEHVRNPGEYPISSGKFKNFLEMS